MDDASSAIPESTPILLTETFSPPCRIQQSIGDSNNNQTDYQLNQNEIKTSTDLWSVANTQQTSSDNWTYYSPYLPIQGDQEYLNDDNSTTIRFNQAEKIDSNKPSIEQQQQSTDSQLSQPLIADTSLSSSPPATIQQLLSSSSPLSSSSYSLSTPMVNQVTSLEQEEFQSSIDSVEAQQNLFECVKSRQDSNQSHHRWNNNSQISASICPSICSQICQIHGARSHPYYNPYMVCNRSSQVYYPAASLAQSAATTLQPSTTTTEFQLSSLSSSSPPPLQTDSYSLTSLDNQSTTSQCNPLFNSIQSRHESVNHEIYSHYHRWPNANPHCLQVCQIHASQHYNPHYNPHSVRCNRPPQQYYQSFQSSPSPQMHQHLLALNYQETSLDGQCPSSSRGQISPASSLKMATISHLEASSTPVYLKRSLFHQ